MSSRLMPLLQSTMWQTSFTLAQAVLRTVKSPPMPIHVYKPLDPKAYARRWHIPTRNTEQCDIKAQAAESSQTLAPTCWLQEANSEQWEVLGATFPRQPGHMDCRGQQHPSAGKPAVVTHNGLGQHWAIILTLHHSVLKTILLPISAKIHSKGGLEVKLQIFSIN